MNRDYVFGLIFVLLAIKMVVMTRRIDMLGAEHMTANVDNEGLQNLASMYKNKKLKVSELEVTGKLVCNGGGYFGPAYIGQSVYGPSMAQFSHKNKDGKYAIIQSNDGTTLINSGNNKSLSLRLNNAERISVSHKSAHLKGTTKVDALSVHNKEPVLYDHGNTKIRNNTGHWPYPRGKYLHAGVNGWTKIHGEYPGGFSFHK